MLLLKPFVTFALHINISEIRVPFIRPQIIFLEKLEDLNFYSAHRYFKLYLENLSPCLFKQQQKMLNFCSKNLTKKLYSKFNQFTECFYTKDVFFPVFINRKCRQFINFNVSYRAKFLSQKKILFRDFSVRTWWQFVNIIYIT